MKSKIDLYNYLMKYMWAILVLGSFAVVSCTDKLCTVSANAEVRTKHLQSFNRSKYGAQKTLSPYSGEYKAYLQRKYFGSDLKKESKVKSVVDNAE